MDNPKQMMMVKSMEEGGGGNNFSGTFNKHACACAAVASMIAVIFGYGKLLSPSLHGFIN